MDDTLTWLDDLPTLPPQAAPVFDPAWHADLPPAWRDKWKDAEPTTARERAFPQMTLKMIWRHMADEAECEHVQAILEGRIR